MTFLTPKTALAFVLTMGLLTGCGEKFLDETPRELVTTENFYRTESDAIQATTAAYSQLSRGGQYNYALWGRTTRLPAAAAAAMGPKSSSSTTLTFPPATP